MKRQEMGEWLQRLEVHYDLDWFEVIQAFLEQLLNRQLPQELLHFFTSALGAFLWLMVNRPKTNVRVR